MGNSAAQFKEALTRVAVSLVLKDGIMRSLFGEAVFQFKGEDWQAIDEQHKIKGTPRFVTAVAQLTSEAETVLFVEDPSLFVLARGGAIKEFNMMRSMVDAMAKHIHDAAS